MIKKAIISFFLSVLLINNSYANHDFITSSFKVSEAIDSMERNKENPPITSLSELKLSKEDKTLWCVANFSKLANSGDYVSTRIGLSHGLVEGNKIINDGSNLLGNLLVFKLITHITIGLINDSNISYNEKMLTNKILGAAFSGATFNNLTLALMKVEPTVAVVGGLATALLVYYKIEDWCAE